MIRPVFSLGASESQTESSVLIEQSISTTSTPTNPFEDKITYSVVMPNTEGKGFYPYTGWILKEAGLFCDSRFLIGGEVDQTTDTFKQMPSGIMMFKRNITPVIKTEDSEIEFKWSIIVSS
jgi:hypothetical protein